MEKSETCRFSEWTKSLLAMAASLVACGAAAKDLTWTGATGANWDTTTANWVLTGTTTPATFADGDNVLIKSGTYTTSSLMMTRHTKPGDVRLEAGAGFAAPAGESVVITPSKGNQPMTQIAFEKVL